MIGSRLRLPSLTCAIAALVLISLTAWTQSTHAQATIPTVGPIIDFAGVWESDLDLNYPSYPQSFRLKLERTGQTNFTDAVNVGYRGTIDIAYTGIERYDTNIDQTPRFIPCTTSYTLGGYIRTRYEGGEYSFLISGTNYVQLQPGEPPTPLTISLIAEGKTKDLRSGPLRLNTYYQDRRHLPSVPVVDFCGENIHRKFNLFSFMRRVAELPPELKVVGNIYGRAFSELQTNTDETNAVHRGDVFLFQQDQYIARQRAGQSDEEYAVYLAERRARRQVVAHTRFEAADRGAFTFRDLPIYRAVIRNGSTAYELARYNIEIRNAETDEDVIPDVGVPAGATEVLYFATGDFPNCIPGSDERPAPLRPFDGISAKRALATQLSELGPVNYKPPEERVLSYLAELEQRADRSEASLEGLRRALWAERIARDGGLLAKDLNEMMLDGFATIVGDVMEDVDIFKRRGLRERERQIEILEGADLDSAANRGFKTPLVNGMREQLKTLQRNELGILSEVAEALKALTDTMLSAVKAISLAQGVDPAKTDEALGGLEFVLNTILNAAISQSAGAFSESVKALIKSTQESFFDGPGFSFTGRTDDLLAFSEQRMRSWATVDPIAYHFDRSRAISKMERLGDYASTGLQIATMTSAASDGISTAESLAGAGEALPAVKVLEIILKVAKYANNSVTFGVPAVLVLHEIPKLMKEGVYAAYGIHEPPPPPVLHAQGQPMQMVQYNFALATDVSVQSSKVISLLTEAGAAIRNSNDFPSAVDLALGRTSGTNQLSMRQASRELQWSIDAVLAQARGSTNSSTNASWALSRLSTLNAETRLAVTTAIDETIRLALDVYRPSFAATNDPIYLARRNRLLEMYQNAQNALNALYDPVTRVASASSRVYPVVMTSRSTVLMDGAESLAVSQSPREFTVQTVLRNVSSIALDQIGATLEVVAPSNSVTLLSAAFQSAGRLERYDNSPGQGSDEVLVTWNCRYTGALTNTTPIRLNIAILERTNAPVSFRTYSNPILLQISDPAFDQDADALPDDFERSAGLDPSLDDSQLDLDGDGLDNEAEFMAGTSVRSRDSDQDGLSDSEELQPGADHQITDPLDADSDNDGLNDGVDAEPLIPGAGETGFRYTDPELVLTPSVVHLSRTNPVAQVAVSSRSGGPISWTALSLDESLVSTSPRTPETRSAGDLLISSAGYAASGTNVMVTTVKVFDKFAGPGSERSVLVIFNSTIDTAPPVAASISGNALTLSWSSAPAHTYIVQYSYDLRTWIDSPTGTFRPAAGQTVTWRDDGLPATSLPPRQTPLRFYRVLPIRSP